MSEELPDTSPPEGSGDGTERDLANEVQKWRHFARQHEERSKSNAARVEQLVKELERHKASSEEAEGLRARAIQAELRSMRFEIAIEKGLPIELARRLAGDDRESIEKDADALVSLISHAGATAGKSTPTPRLRPGAVEGAEPVERDPAKLVQRIPRRSF